MKDRELLSKLISAISYLIKQEIIDEITKIKAFVTEKESYLCT